METDCTPTTDINAEVILICVFNSERKFKGKIKEWKFEKNFTAAEMKFITTKQQTRAREQGKLTTFYKNGIRVNSRKIEKFAKRKIGNVEEILPDAAGM